MNNKNIGFTLIEIIIVLLIVSIIIAFAAPNYSKIIKSKKIEYTAIDIANLFNYSKIKSLAMNENIFICPSYIRTNSRLNNCSNNLNKDGKKLNSFLAFTNNNNIDKYNSKNDINVIKIEDAQNMKFKFYTFKPTQIDNLTKLNNPKFILLTNNKLAVNDNNKNDIIISNIANMAKIIIEDKDNKKICSVVKIESSGKASICSKNTNKDSPDFLICNCK